MQLFNTYNIYNHTIHTINIIHTNAKHAICRNRSPSLILTTHLFNLKRLKKLLSKGRSFRYVKLYYIILYYYTNISHQKTQTQSKVHDVNRMRNSLSLKHTYYRAPPISNLLIGNESKTETVFQLDKAEDC